MKIVLAVTTDKTIDRGNIYGLVGKNGAGKTTLIKSIAGLIKPTMGDIELFGVSAPGRCCSMQSGLGLWS